ncbi:hypothetical protein QJS82_11495 [Psychrobacter maritimus]|jgi:hypothetical protein|uniref:hypothetical protein n=1 Tax=Psychrobacter maritimus TaxID=256325 RepID=UPI00248C0FFA|nr:hypothetical protein [Psychrobacter sp. WB2]WGV12778.1 hypothetical protein QJS82_11495 [Psychrobacter sp. WB2]
MKKSTLSLSLLIGAALTIPSLAMAAPADKAAAEKQTAVAATTLEPASENTNSKSVANQANPIQISETQTISRSKVSVNNSASQQPMTTELQAEQASMQKAAMQNPEDALQPQAQDEMLEEEAVLEEESLETEEDVELTEDL